MGKEEQEHIKKWEKKKHPILLLTIPEDAKSFI